MPVIVVFDFDCTLTVEHMYYFYNNENDVKRGILSKTPLSEIIKTPDLVDTFINFFFGGRVRLNEITLMLNSLIGNGCKIYISTMGIPADVKTALMITGLSKYISGVSNRNKADFIQDLSPGNPPIYYIDDSANFINDITVNTVYFGGNDYLRSKRSKEYVTFINIRLDREMYGLDSKGMRTIMREILEQRSLCLLL